MVLLYQFCGIYRLQIGSSRFEQELNTPTHTLRMPCNELTVTFNSTFDDNE